MLKSKGKVKPYHLEECKDYENVVRYDFAEDTALRIGRKVGYRVRRFMRQDVLREC